MLCVSGAYIHLSPLHIGQLERNSTQLYPQSSQTCILPLFRVLDGSYFRQCGALCNYFFATFSLTKQYIQLLSLGLKDLYKDGVQKLGFNIEDLLEKERDAALGNGGLGRLAACYLDSSAAQELPVWGYGLRYKYGIFQQHISPDGEQLEVRPSNYMTGMANNIFQAPDPWLDNQNPWELPRLDVTYEIRFYGYAERMNDNSGRAIWQGGQEVLAVAYDVMIPGYETSTTNNLRLWESKPKRGFDLNSFNGTVVHP